MDRTTTYTPQQRPDITDKRAITDFLYNHLDKFGDKWDDIHKAIDYSVKDIESFGGFTLKLENEDGIIGAVVVNETGMSGYIPENILVYIAIHRDHRGKGVGKRLMKEAIEQCKGNIALHVEPDNPARHLYKNLGFSNKYLEMRLSR